MEDLTFGAVAVEAEGEGLGEFKGPLGEGGYVEGGEVGDVGSVGVGGREVAGEGEVFIVGEELEGGEGVVGGFGEPGFVLEKVLLVRGEIAGGGWGAFSSSGCGGFAFSAGGEFGGCCCRFGFSV